MEPICEIRVTVAEIKGVHKEASFWPHVVKGVADSYNDSFGHTYTPLIEKVHPEIECRLY